MTDDDYKSDVFFEVGKDKIYYAYKFDEDIDLTNVTSTDTLNIDFLGTPMKFTSVSAGQFDAYVGEEHYLNTGDSVTVAGKTIKLIDVSSTSVVIEVDGTNKIVTTSSSQTVNGIEVTVDSVFSRTERAESSANLILGVQSSETYKDGDAYIGEDKDDPDWVWDISTLTTAGTSAYSETALGAATANKVLRVENDFVWNDDTDNPVGVGGCIVLPNEYVSICLDSLSVADSDYKEFEFELDTSADFSDSFASLTEVKAIHMSTLVDEGFELPAYTAANGDVLNESSAVKAKDVWLYESGADSNSSNGTQVTNTDTEGGLLDVFYKDISDNKIKWHGSVNGTDTTVIAAINYENTKGTGTQGNIRLFKTAHLNTTGYINFTLDVNADSTSDLDDGQDNIVMKWGFSSGKFNSLGSTADTEESSELAWGPTPTYIGTKDEDHKTYYGIVIKDPKGQASSDRVKLLIPNDQVFANIVIKGKAATVSAGGTSYVPAEVSAKTMLASEVSDATSYNLIVVGGPCANPLAESVFGVTCDGWDYKEGVALVKVVDNGNKVALLVAGTTALDTRRAAKAVANYKDYAFSGAEVLVKGTTLSDISVESA
ncbi:hypothetical protein COV16_02080 [Candidatus Woesearchaeota archaeon CG10_big_fil_rev_8_21_14_0_10_34_8]|nr:MAG: hypothetical protein COV16_02080 [Candidatus Woesearchaeota archaeon CG10_big_fil_rev_8_21_14_0_10_34_8]